MVTTKTITREKIAHILKSKLGLSSIICEEIVEQIFKNIQQMASNQRLTLAGFGSFCTSTKKGSVKLSKIVSKRAIFLDFRQQEVFEWLRPKWI
ncbi:HU family DNA-binding protein [Candidatus Tisiphia endosymbiont of Neophilaenus lineatus]|uniref:HU family DNA-binding protein n=1 Tax=Candidatus Tisiphia endosymbiont of Neophilaenus lineatus TaxID=3139336 RepID=UPI0035CB8D92